MRIRRRSLRKFLAVLGCVVATVSYPAAMVGGLLMLAGSGVHLWSKGCLQQNLRLTTAGPYRWTRNPFYLANLLIDLGLEVGNTPIADLLCRSGNDVRALVAEVLLQLLTQFR